MTHHNHSAPPSAFIDPPGRRAFQRYPVDLHAFIMLAHDIRLSCVIRDFCIDGMFLSYQQPAYLVTMTQGCIPAAGDIITIHCLVPATNQSNWLQFQARVVRAFDNGVGVAFINPDLNAVQIMHDFSLRKNTARLAGQPQWGEPSKTSTAKKSYSQSDITNNVKIDRIIKECNRIIADALEGITKSINSKMPDRMFEISRDTNNHKEQNVYFNAHDILKKSSEILAHAFHSTIHQQLKDINHEKLRASSEAKLDDNNVSMSELSLVEDEALTEWLCVSDINYSIESRQKKILVAIEQRLSMVFNIPIGKDNNPYGPNLFTESFLSAIKNLGLTQAANMICLSVFKDVLIEKSCDIYKTLDTVLTDFGILPDFKYKVPERNTIQRASTPPSNTADNNNVTKRNLYQINHEMRKLREEIAHQTSSQATIPLSSQENVLHSQMLSSNMNIQLPPSSPLPEQTYTVSDVISALASLQADHNGQVINSNESRNIKSRIISILENINSGGTQKEISPHDSSVIEVAGDLFNAIQGDSLVANSVRPWLKRLEIPILRLTLDDNTVFLDRTHVARQVLNKIAQLEIHDNEQEDSSQNTIKNTIDRLIDRINTEFDGTTEVFEKILVQLDRLIKIQDHAYSENVKDVITVCKKHTVMTEPEEDPVKLEADISDPAWGKWLKQARRLKESDWVLFLTDEDNARRLRIAWISEQGSVYVFVNSLGLQEKAIDINNLARKMCRGTAIPLDNADDPAMDRAQYTALQELHEQLLYETTHDQLTGLISRREFEAILSKAVVRARQTGIRHVLCLIDIDKFSAINNSCGYAGGDKLLKELADLLQKELNDRGSLARFGSDEFVMLVEDSSLDDTLEIAEQQINTATDYRFEWEDKRFSVALSMGLVPVNARNSNITELLQAAESSCKIAKDTGGNRLQVYHAGHSQLAQRSAVMKWVGKIDEILEEDRLQLFCQRINPINGDPNISPHFEILLRVTEDQETIILPHEFIQAAEWYGRMIAVDRWVITKVFKWMADNRSAMENIGTFSINISGQSITDDNFTNFVLEQMNDTKIQPHKICFEVTETVGITNLSDATAFILDMKKTGCMFALDDFGSGMSSYAYLKNLPVDIIKIDGVFVKNMEGNSIDYALVKSICEVGHFMNKKVVAEYVENDAILNLLGEIGVDYVQGYIIDKPGPLDRLIMTNNNQQPAKTN